MKFKKLKRSIVKDSIFSFASSVINRIGTLIFTIILARLLTPSGYGLYSIIFSTAMIFYTFADLGINQALVKYTSQSLHRAKNKLPAYYHYLLKIKFFLTLTVSVALIICSYPISVYIFKNKEIFIPLIISAFYIFILSFENFYSGFLYSANKVNILTFKESINQILRIISIILLLSVIASSYEIIGIFLALIIISLVLFLLVFLYIRKICPQMFEKTDANINKKEVLHFVSFLTIASISGVFFSYIDSVMLGIFLQPEYVGYYRAAFSLVLGIIGLVSFPSVILLPLFTKLDKTKIENVFNRAIKYSAILAIPACFGLLVLSRYFLNFFYGYSYLPAALPLSFLAFLIIPIIMVSLFLNLFSAEGKPQILAKLILYSCILNIILNYVFIKLFLLISPLWATAGAAIATLISWTFYLVASIYYVKKEFDIRVSLKSLIKPLIAGLVMSLVIIIATHYLKNIGLLSGIGEVLLGILVYFVTLIIIRGIKKEDFELIYLIIKKK